MAPRKTDRLDVRTSDDVVRVRQQIRSYAVEAGLSLVDQTKVITAASELARNAIDYGGGGRAIFELLDEGGRKGVRAIFEDSGPGIADINAALKDGFTTGNGLGLGLGGAKRLCNDFSIDSAPGKGTRVTITRWKP